jgi:hypothetical protein
MGMAEGQTSEVRPVGRARRIAGNFIIGFGVYLWIICVWHLMAHAPLFGYADWLRFWVALWTGSVFIPAGGWLRFRSRAALWVAVLVFACEVAFLAWFDHWVKHLPPPA